LEQHSAIATAIDPAHASDYTRSGLEVFFIGRGSKSLVRYIKKTHH